MMSLSDGKGVVFTIDGDVIGGVDSWQEQAGRNPEVDTNYLSGFDTQPGQHEYGRITLNVYRKGGDVGQTRLSQALVNRETIPMTLTLLNGETFSFDVYVVQFGISASDTGTGTTPCILRMASAVI